MQKILSSLFLRRLVLIFVFCVGSILAEKNPEVWAYEDEVHAHPEFITPFKPTFFILGSTHSKLQFSFKAKLIESVPFFLAYTQTSFWDLFRYSSPFSDTSYSPELLYRFTVNEEHSSWLDFGGQHESNGRDGSQSRAWNRLYGRFSSKEDLGKTHLYYTLQAWIPFASEDQSQDLVHYRGLYELTVTWSDFLGDHFDQDDLTLRLFPGGSSEVNPFVGGQELTLRLKSKERKFLPLLVFQMFHGVGESLLDFKDKVWVARIGLGL